MNEVFTPEEYTVIAVRFIAELLNDRGLTDGLATENTGEQYQNDVFSIYAHDWSMDEMDRYGPNFWYKPLNYQMDWYKHIGRGTVSNKPLTIEQAWEILDNCKRSIDRSILPPGDEYFWQEDEE